MSANKSNDTTCDAPFDDATSVFFEPVTTSVFKPGDTVPIRWYAGVVPQGSGGSSSSNMTFNLVLSGFRNDSFVYDVLKNITVPFSGRANKEPVYWSYIPSAPCPITEISYFWPIPDTFMAASKTDFDYVLLVETIIKTGWALGESDPFRIVAPDPSGSASSSISSTSSAPMSASSNVSTTPDSGSDPPAGSSRNLSSGAIAGIAVASILGGLALVLAAWILFKRRKSKSGYSVPHEDTHPSIPGMAEGETVASTAKRSAPVAGGNEKVEIDGRQIARESGGIALYELEAGQRREQRDTVISELSDTTLR